MGWRGESRVKTARPPDGQPTEISTHRASPLKTSAPKSSDTVNSPSLTAIDAGFGSTPSKISVSPTWLPGLGSLLSSHRLNSKSHVSSTVAKLYDPIAEQDQRNRGWQGKGGPCSDGARQTRLR